MALRLLADENVYKEIVDQLRAAGYDIRTVQDAGQARAADAEVLRLARTENRVLLTFDRDFGDIRYLPRDVPGIVLLRFRQTLIEEITERVLETLGAVSEDELRNSLTVITPLHTRHRPLKSRMKNRPVCTERRRRRGHECGRTAHGLYGHPARYTLDP